MRNVETDLIILRITGQELILRKYREMFILLMYTVRNVN